MQRIRREFLLFPALLLPVAGAAWTGWRILGQPPLGVDDADIFLAYARHWLAGEGLVFSSGGERVEGFSSPLWLALCTAALAATASPEPLLRVISVLLSAAAVTAATAFAVSDLAPEAPGPDRGGRWLRGGLTAAWSLASPAYCVWTSLTLMDTALQAAVVCTGSVAVARAARRRFRAGEAPGPARAVCAAVALMLLTRSEGMAVGLAWAAALGAAVGLRRRSAAAGLRAARAPLVTWLVVLAALTAFRLAYFGYLLPNTYYAKVSPDLGYNLEQGLGYLLQFGAAHPLAGLSAGCAAAGALLCALRLPSYTRSSPLLAALFALCALCLAELAIPALVGGDHFALFRLGQPFWPLLPLPLLAFFAPGSPLGLARPGRRDPGEARWPAVLAGALAAAGAGFAIFFANQPIWPELGDARRFQNEFALAHSGRFLALQLNQLQRGQPPLRVGVLVCGGFGYAYRGPVVDLLGLNLVQMAHSPGDRRGLKNHAAFDADVLFALEPELLFPDAIEGVDPRPLAAQLLPTSFENRVTKGLLGEPRFQQRYAPVSLGAGSGPPDSLRITAFARRDVIPRLRERGLAVRVFQPAELRAGGAPSP